MEEGKPIRKRRLGKPRHSWEEILGWTLKKYVSIRGIRLIRLRIGILESPCGCGTEPLGSISDGVN